MQFAHPYLLWLIPFVAPALIGFFWWSARKRRDLLAAFIHARLLPGLLVGISDRRRRFREGCIVFSLCLAIVALARPQWGFTWDEVKQRGLDIVIAIDISKSMLARDIEPNRLTRAKLAALDMMQHARSDRLGLVAFAGSAFLQCPLTIDDAVFRQSVEGLDVQSVSRGGTAIAGAIEAAMGAFTEADNYKVLVLLTDGEDHDSGALDAARHAAEKGLEIFTIGIGTPAGEMVQAKDASGKLDFVRDEQGNVVKSRLNETMLQELAGVTQRGFYLPMRGAKVIDTLYEKGLAPIPKSESGEKLVKRFHERYYWPLGIAIVLLITEMLFPERKRQKVAGARDAIPALAKLSLTVLLLQVGLAAHASSGSAARAYEDGDYQRALREYKRTLGNKGAENDPRLHFNAGNAAYKSRQLEEAVNQFNEALSSRDVKLQQRAFYNRGNTFFALGDASPDPQNKNQAWQKSLKDFESALKLDPQDKDAAFNRDFVKRKLEELQQQQQDQKKQDDQNDHQQDQQDQQKQDQQKQDQQKQDQQKQDQQKQDQQKQDQQKQDQQKQDQQKQDQQKQDQQKQDQQKQDQQKQDQQKQDPGHQEQQDQEKQQQQAGQDKKDQEQQQQKRDQEKEAEQQAASAAPGQMTPEQARQLLDAQKGEEKILQFRPEEKPADTSRPLKDW